MIITTKQSQRQWRGESTTMNFKPIKQVALAEWLRRVPAKYMGFPRERAQNELLAKLQAKIKGKNMKHPNQ
ncbi:unnamed protein product [Sphenostylis stenocarpa]|uniref:Uncharacterized protein n=1 Tax=Sphenostylis stenocarpa TaxID=92480 RepID=A0AA86SV97_9FABA|nr:unnamed protein product [Sphenostylis stenocarpa]